MSRAPATLLLLASLAASLLAQAPKKAPLAPGQLLVATSKLPDPRFAHAVILLTNVSSRGIAGLVLNHESNEPLSGLFSNVRSARSRTDKAFWGGPMHPAQRECLVWVDGPLHEGTPVLPGVYVSANESLMELALNAARPSGEFRVYLGFTAWSPGQLPAELRAGLWRLVLATPQLLFDPTPSTLWSRLSTPAAAPAPAQP